MGENEAALELKRERLKEELNKSNPDYYIIERLKESIRRHNKSIA